MKNLFTKLIFSLCLAGFLALPASVRGQDDAIARLFEQYIEDEAFTSIYISPRMFKLISDLDKKEGEEALDRTVNKLGGLRILTADSIPGMKLYNQAIKKLELNRYEELMRVKDVDGNMRFMIQETSEGKIRELLMLIGAQNSFFMLSIIGDLDLETIAKIGESVDIDGFNELERLKEDKKE
ncbi:MAG: DUF4252 domain-containing protein [Bacteroidota bacterium]